MPGLDDAREAGASALTALRVKLAESLARLLRLRPDLVETAVEVGLIDRDWLAEPGQHPFRIAPALDVVERFLERSSEQEPSLLAALGLRSLQLLAAGRPARSSDPAPVPVTIVFTDLEGFTRYTAREGDEAATALLGRQHRAVGPIVRSRGGRVVKRLGDGLMLAFPSPESAVMAALEMSEAVREPLPLRAGIHTGEAVVTPDDLIGHDVNVAARVADVAKGSQVLATTAVRDAVVGLSGVRFGRARRRTFKGVGEPVMVCAVTVEAAA